MSRAKAATGGVRRMTPPGLTCKNGMPDALKMSMPAGWKNHEIPFAGSVYESADLASRGIVQAVGHDRNSARTETYIGERQK